MAFIAVQGTLTLEENTGRKFLAHRAAVYARTGKVIIITAPYGAFRTPQQQGYLRSGWERGLPGFYYAAPVGGSNHEDGDAYDVNNWAAVGEQVIKEEAWRLKLVRDPSERWHWNNPRGPYHDYNPAGLALAGTTGKVLIILSWETPLIHTVTGKPTPAGDFVRYLPAFFRDLTARINQIHDWEQNDGSAFKGLVARIAAAVLGGVGRNTWEHGIRHYAKGVGDVKAADYLVSAEMSAGKAVRELQDGEHGLAAILAAIERRGAPTSMALEISPEQLVAALSDPRVAKALGPGIGQHVVDALHARTAPTTKENP